MAAEPLISVVVPVYNVESELGRCVDSLLSQEGAPAFEVVLVDDGSTDSSGALCDALAAGDARVRALHKANGGLSDARNFGLANSSAPLVAFVDSDDYVLPGYLSALYRLLESHGADVSACRGLVVRTGEEAPDGGPAEVRAMGREEALGALLYDEVSVSAWGKLWRREALGDAPFPKGRLFEDVGATPLLFLRCGRVASTSERLYCYVMRPGSISHQRLSERSFDRAELAEASAAAVAAELPGLARAAERYVACHKMAVLRMRAEGGELDGRLAELRREVLASRAAVLGDPRAGLRDKLGLLSLALGRGFYLAAWDIYSKATGRS